jgi:hypothetical protein
MRRMMLCLSEETISELDIGEGREVGVRVAIKDGKLGEVVAPVPDEVHAPSTIVIPIRRIFFSIASFLHVIKCDFRQKLRKSLY